MPQMKRFRARFPKHDVLLRDPSVVKELARSAAGPDADLDNLSEDHWKTIERLLGMKVPTAYLRARSVPTFEESRSPSLRAESAPIQAL